MKTVEVTINNQTFKISRNNLDSYSFSVFNHATFHVIEKNNFGVWKDIEHRFGDDNLPIAEIGEAIDKSYDLLEKKA